MNWLDYTRGYEDGKAAAGTGYRQRGLFLSLLQLPLKLLALTIMLVLITAGRIIGLLVSFIRWAIGKT